MGTRNTMSYDDVPWPPLQSGQCSWTNYAKNLIQNNVPDEELPLICSKQLLMLLCGFLTDLLQYGAVKELTRILPIRGEGYKSVNSQKSKHAAFRRAYKMVKSYAVVTIIPVVMKLLQTSLLLHFIWRKCSQEPLNALITG